MKRIGNLLPTTFYKWVTSNTSCCRLHLKRHWKIVLGSARRGLIFHQKPGGNTARRADPTWPNRAAYSIPCATMLGAGWGELGGRNSVVPRERAAAAGGESCSVGSAILCCVFSLSVSLLLFSLFVVLLNCPYADPPAHPSGGRAAGRPRDPSVASHGQTITKMLFLQDNQLLITRCK